MSQRPAGLAAVLLLAICLAGSPLAEGRRMKSRTVAAKQAGHPAAAPTRQADGASPAAGPAAKSEAPKGGVLSAATDAVVLGTLGAVDATRAFVKRVAFDLDGPCLEDGLGERVGCTADCQCGWGRRCYQRYALVDESGAPRAASFDVGVCDIDMRLPLASGLFFFSVVFLGSLVFYRYRYPLGQADKAKEMNWSNLLHFAREAGEPPRFAAGGPGERPAAGMLPSASGDRGLGSRALAPAAAAAAAAASPDAAAPVGFPREDPFDPFAAKSSNTNVARVLGAGGQRPVPNGLSGTAHGPSHPESVNLLG